MPLKRFLEPFLSDIQVTASSIAWSLNFSWRLDALCLLPQSLGSSQKDPLSYVLYRIAFYVDSIMRLKISSGR